MVGCKLFTAVMNHFMTETNFLLSLSG